MKLEQGTFTVFRQTGGSKTGKHLCPRFFIKKESLARVFFREISKNSFCYETPPVTALARVFFCKISKNNFCYETPPVTASGQILNFSSDYQP